LSLRTSSHSITATPAALVSFENTVSSGARAVCTLL
jgi:hypothetical protein